MNNQYLALILQNLVLFPNQEVKMEFTNDLSKQIIEEAYKNNDGEILVVNPKDELEIKPDIKDLPKIVTFARIKAKITLPNGKLRVNLRGFKRSQVTEYLYSGDALVGKITTIQNPPYDLEKEEMYVRKLKSIVDEYINLSSLVSNAILGVIKNVSSLSKLTDIISASFNFRYLDKEKLIHETDYFKRAETLIGILNNDISLFKFDKKIEEEVQESFRENEKEIYIKEKIEHLSKELGNRNDVHEECARFREKIAKISIDPKIATDLEREILRLESTLGTSPEASVIRSYLEFVTDLPWDRSSLDKKDIEEIDKQVNETHYGLNRAKDRIEEYLVLKNNNYNLHSPILCLVGPPGTGKTTFARELAKSIGREFIKISVGGLNDSSELLGHRRTYLGAGPGKIMESIRKCQVNNPVILIDEVDKMVKDYKGDPASVMLEILDQNQNKEFVDNYVREPFDLSNVLFILTANDKENIPLPLLDRLEIIDINSYTLFDKLEIAHNYTLPRMGKEYNFDYKKIVLTDAVLTKIINDYTCEAGVRELERQIASIIRKVLIQNSSKKVTIKEKDLAYYLGSKKYSRYENAYANPGCVNVPAVIYSGGIVLNVEVAIYPGKEEIISTGSLGNVMKESVLIAVSYIKNNAKKLKIDLKKLSGSTIHIHALDGATKKEGPSAGLAILVAILSFLSNKKIPNNLAFTGELSLEGRVLKVGGIKEKIISCYNAGIDTVYIPKNNIQDLEGLPKKIKDSINIIFVDDFFDIFKDLFSDK